MRHSRLIALYLLAVPTFAPACCGVTNPGKRVNFLSQTNIIVWNPETKTEQFIRKAWFSSNGQALGFVAPTPTKPELDEVDESIINLFNSLRPQPKSPPASGGLGGFGGGGGVQVLEEKEVAGFDATVLKADDQNALYDWLLAHEFENSENITKWAAQYIAKKWILTIFKVNVRNGSAKTKLVRMTFKTDQPYNPYVVPSANISQEKAVRTGLMIYFVGPGIYDVERKPWNSSLKIELEARMTDSFRETLAKLVKLDPEVPEYGITAFLDYGFPVRNAPDDLWFNRVAPVPEPLVQWAKDFANKKSSSLR